MFKSTINETQDFKRRKSQLDGFSCNHSGNMDLKNLRPRNYLSSRNHLEKINNIET